MFLHQTDGSPIKIWAHADQADLVEVVTTLKQLLGAKGEGEGGTTIQPLSGCWTGPMTNKHLERGNHRVMSTEAPIRLSTSERRSIPVLRSYTRSPDGRITSVTILCSFPFRRFVPLRRSILLRCSISPVPLSIGPPFGLTGYV